MATYALRRLLLAVPTLLFISLVVFLLLDLAPSDPTASLPLTIPPEVRERIRESLGLDEPVHVRYLLWCRQFLLNEPLNLLDALLGRAGEAERLRVLSWQTRSPVADLIVERLPQTLWVVGLSYLIGALIALPVGVVSACRQYGWFDLAGTFVSTVGFSVPTFFTGVLMIVVFSSQLGWLPSIYDTTHRVTDWGSLLVQARQMAMPVFVLALYNAAQISRFTRASMLDNLGRDYARAARGKGLRERRILFVHVLRNAMIPVVTVIALGAPQVFGGAIITEQIFKVNGLGQLLIVSIQGGDLPTAQTLVFIFAALIVAFNLAADLLYGALDPSIRHDV